MGSGDPWLVIQHVAFEGPGSIALALSDAGADLTLVRVDRGDVIPPPAAADDLAGLVVMGGPMSVADDLQWREIDGAGSVYTFTVARRPTGPAKVLLRVAAKHPEVVLEAVA